MSRLVLASIVTVISLGSTTPAAAKDNDRRVCVDVVLRGPKAENPAAEPSVQPASRPTAALGLGMRPRPKSKPPRSPRPRGWGYRPGDSERGVDLSLLPVGQEPTVYLRRLVEHFVTHQPGFVAVRHGCAERIRVELYPLRRGWTVFARYSGHGREERVDQLHADELSQFAERAVVALLDDRPISSTVKRDTVLRADSEKSLRTISGSHHFVIGLGTQLRSGKISTATSGGRAESKLRVFSPMMLTLGYRARFENWGIEAMSQLGINAGKTSIAKNSAGGHVDLGGTFGTSLHFLRYTQPRGVTSFYFGGGSTFELLWFSVIKAQAQRIADNRSTLVSGGLDLDVVFGYEFMRASSVQFILQGELNLPAYALNTENSDGEIHSWFPGVTVKLGMMF